MTSTDTPGSPVVLYWRPGCPFCSGLKRRLRQLGVRTTEVNIWADPRAAAAVRAVAGGNETVPTVIIAGTAMVNPTGPQVLEAARRLAPDAIEADTAGPDRTHNRPALAVPAAWLVLITAVVAGFAVDAYGHSDLNWAVAVIAVIAVAAFVALPLLRRRTGRRPPRRRRPPELSGTEPPTPG